MKILIIYDEDANELWYYIPENGKHPFLIQPRIKKESEEKDDEDDERVIH